MQRKLGVGGGSMQEKIRALEAEGSMGGDECQVRKRDLKYVPSLCFWVQDLYLGTK